MEVMFLLMGLKRSDEPFSFHANLIHTFLHPHPIPEHHLAVGAEFQN